MASTIQIKRGTGSAVPSGLADGELAINLDNGKLFYGSSSVSVNSFTFKNLTAENYIVSTSVTNITTQTLSGSTDFGDDSGDIHKRTGSLNVSGALSIDGNIKLSNNDKIFVGSSGTEIIANNDDYWKINANGLEAARFSSAGVTINEGGAAPVDFRVESNSDTHLLFVDAGANKMAIGTNTVSDSLLTVDGDVKVTNITASGNISASGTIVGSNLTNVENTAISTFAGTSNITTVGTIGTGTWQGTAIADAYLSSNTAHLTGTQTFSGAKTFSANPVLSGTTKLIAADMEAIHNDGSQLVISQDNRISKLRGTSFNVDTNITASGNISASGIITGKLGTTDTNVDAAHYTVLQTAANTVPFISNAFSVNPSTNTVDINIADIDRNKFAKTSNTDGNAQGDVVFFGGTTSMTTGAIYHYKSDGTWELADADAASTSDGLLAVALGAASDTNGMLLRGMVTLDHDPGAVGDVLYLSTTAGDATATAPSGNGDIVRIIGYCLDATNGQIWFNPDSTFVEVNA